MLSTLYAQPRLRGSTCAADAGHRFVIAGEPREDDVDHRARFRNIQTDGAGAQDRDHVLAADRDGRVPIQVQRQRPRVQANHRGCIPRRTCLQLFARTGGWTRRWQVVCPEHVDATGGKGSRCTTVGSSPSGSTYD